jgi:hypothetical protein
MLRLNRQVLSNRTGLSPTAFHKALLGPPTSRIGGKWVWDRLPEFLLVVTKAGISLEISDRYPTNPKAWDAVRAYKRAVFGISLDNSDLAPTVSLCGSSLVSTESL